MQRRTLGLFILGIALSQTGAWACSPGQPEGKGPESNVPAGGKLDSFAQPSQHGTLVFGIANTAQLRDKERFHSWVFELSAPASVSLKIVPGTDNLDTVMYLYQRQGDSSDWGSYIARNDDDEGNLWSALDLELGAGTYRVLIKGYKEEIRGYFDLVASCGGAGCPASVGDVPKLPPPTDISVSCVERLNAVLRSPVQTRREITASQDALAQLPDLERYSAKYYGDHFVDLYGADFYEDYNGGFSIETTQHEQGTTVDVEVSGSDEMRLTFVYDEKDALIMYGHSEQSPSQYWFCARAGEPLFQDPDEFCFHDYLASAPHSTAEEQQGSGSASAGSLANNTTMHKCLKVALSSYAQAAGLAKNRVISYSYTLWQPDEWSAGAEVLVEAPGHAAFIYLVNSYQAFMRISASGTIQLVCAEP